MIKLKSQFLIVEKLILGKFVRNGENLETVDCFKCLSVVMNYSDSFKIAVEELHQQASCAMFAIFCKCIKFDLSVDITLGFFCAPYHVIMVLSHISKILKESDRSQQN